MNGGIVARKNLLQTIIALNSHLMYEHFMSNQLATLFVRARRWMAANAGEESEKISRTFCYSIADVSILTVTKTTPRFHVNENGE